MNAEGGTRALPAASGVVAECRLENAANCPQAARLARHWAKVEPRCSCRGWVRISTSAWLFQHLVATAPDEAKDTLVTQNLELLPDLRPNVPVARIPVR